MFTKNMNQNVQSRTIHNSTQLETIQMPTNSIVRRSAKIFSKESKYLDSSGKEAKSTYYCITSLCSAPTAVQSNRVLQWSLLQLLNCHCNVKAATDNAKKNACDVFQ